MTLAAFSGMAVPGLGQDPSKGTSVQRSHGSGVRPLFGIRISWSYEDVGGYS